jgi:hypothetical protein
MNAEINSIIKSHFKDDKSIHWYAEKTLADKRSYLNVKQMILNSIAYWKTGIHNYGEDTKAAEEMEIFIKELTTLLNYGKLEKYEE